LAAKVEHGGTAQSAGNFEVYLAEHGNGGVSFDAFANTVEGRVAVRAQRNATEGAVLTTWTTG